MDVAIEQAKPLETLEEPEITSEGVEEEKV